jgi:hypothetical protein
LALDHQLYSRERYQPEFADPLYNTQKPLAELFLIKGFKPFQKLKFENGSANDLK